MRLREMMGSVGAIVSCGDCKNPNFQIQGALCGKYGRKSKTLNMRFDANKKREV